MFKTKVFVFLFHILTNKTFVSTKYTFYKTLLIINFYPNKRYNLLEIIKLKNQTIQLVIVASIPIKYPQKMV